MNSMKIAHDNSHSPLVAIMILNYDGLSEVVDCIQSIRTTVYPNLKVVLVDNGSSDGSVQHVRREYPWVQAVPLDRNYGFARAYNIAVNQVDADYVLFLNNDITTVDDHWLNEMVSLAESRPGIAAVGPKLLIAANPERIDVVGGKVYRWLGATPLGHEEEDVGQYDKPPVEPFYLPGGALLVRKTIFQQVGGFDQAIFAYAEDLDLCWRLRLMGYEIAYCPTAALLHKGSSLWKRFASAKLSHSQQNFLYVCLKNYSTHSLAKEIPAFVFLNLAGAFALSITHSRREPFSAVSMSMFRNLLRLRNTLTQRVITQARRVTSETKILQAMGPQRLLRYGEVKNKLSVFLRAS